MSELLKDYRISGVTVTRTAGLNGDYDFMVHLADDLDLPFFCAPHVLENIHDEIGTALDQEQAKDLTFEEALRLIKRGERLCRDGWNGKGMFVFLVAGSTFTMNREPLSSILGDGTAVTYRPHIDLRAADGSIGVWQPSMSDLLATDWRISRPSDLEGK